MKLGTKRKFAAENNRDESEAIDIKEEVYKIPEIEKEGNMYYTLIQNSLHCFGR